MSEKLKIVILEGARGTGKSSIAQAWRRLVPETTLINPTGFHETSSPKDDLNQIISYYKGLMDMVFSFTLNNVKGTIIFDRFFFTEKVFCDMYKKYDFTDYYRRLLITIEGLSDKIDIKIVHVTAPTYVLAERLQGRNKVQFDKVSEDVHESLAQIDKYREVFKDVDDSLLLEYSNAEGTVEENLEKLLAIIEK